MPRLRSLWRSRGFTLIELLVVIPINRVTPVKQYICPSDFTISGPGWAQNQVGGWMGTSYSYNHMVFGTVHTGNAWVPQYNVGNIPDGSSNTIYFAEQYAACNNNS